MTDLPPALFGPTLFSPTLFSPEPANPDARRNVAVVQPLPGIGDMIWHLPHLRALAAAVGGPVTLIAKPRSAADQLLAAEPAIREVVWLDRNPERRRGRHDGVAGLARFVTMLRTRRFDVVVLLHHSMTLAFAVWLAGVPVRVGYGSGLQRWWLSRGPFLPRAAQRLHPFEQASAWLREAGIALAEGEPVLAVDAAARAAVRARMAGHGPLVAIGIGSSEPYKQWGAERFAALAEGLLAAGWQRLVLIGGAGEAALAAEIVALVGKLAGTVACAIGWNLSEVEALLAEASFYVGNDTGVMNISAAVGTRSYGLFGGWPPFHHSTRIVAILPPDGKPDKATGMARITPAAVLAVIADGQRDRDGAIA
jgi:heptosyltransferase-2